MEVSHEHGWVGPVWSSTVMVELFHTSAARTTQEMLELRDWVSDWHATGWKRQGPSYIDCLCKVLPIPFEKKN